MTLDHVSLHVSDYEKAKDFYAKALAPLGYAIGVEFAEWKVIGFECDGKKDLWMKAGESAPQGTHIAFSAKNKDEVDAFYTSALEAGAKDNGKPGYRKEYSAGYYGAFVIDADGHNIEAVYHDPSPTDK